MKRYFNTFTKTLFFTIITFLFLGIVYYRVTQTIMPFFRPTIGAILMSLIIALAIRVFKSEKGKAYVNVILGYLIIIPAMFVLRQVFGTFLFRQVWSLYILIAIVGVIYFIALLVASKRYKSEVDELNRLLLDKQQNNGLDEEESEEE
ncbi:MAG: DUF3021 family protein [Bacilli bacterium]|nr:DUF3021 family protein [Bacilli bacterium]MBN2876074.1 DUF3021 family protein [Bacilli bacterium]